MKFPIKAVLFLGVAVAVLTSACSTTNSPYFGKTTPPSEQRLVYAIGGEIDTLDPGKEPGSFENDIINALFEGLTSYHPETLEPMAALATRYETNSDQTQFTFYLRGHPNPHGLKLPNTETLRQEYLAGKLKEDFSRGQPAPPDRTPARWSDGSLVTAHDFVYAWQRAVNPETAAPMAYMLYYVKNGKRINAGQLKPEELGVRALDDFTFQVELRAPTPFFLKLTSRPTLFAVPRRAIETARQRGRESSWTEPGQMVTSGASILRAWRPYDRVIIVKNSKYYEADLVKLQEIAFLPILQGTTNVSLYKAGQIDAMPGFGSVPRLLVPVLQERKDFRADPAFFSQYYVINTRKPPFDNVLLRYALNMATDKQAVADFLGAGRTPALHFVPPITGYEIPSSLSVTVDGNNYDVLSHNPAAARELLAKAGFPGASDRHGRRLKIEILFTMLPDIQGIPEILQQQWRRELNVEVNLVNQEFKVFLRTVQDVQYSGVAEFGNWGDYVDPNSMLDLFVTGSVLSGTGWSDPKYDAMLATANATIDPVARMKKLAECELYLLKAMPFIPLFFNTWLHLQKPYVRALGGNMLDKHPFKYARIDTNWKPDTDREQTSRK